ERPPRAAVGTPRRRRGHALQQPRHVRDHHVHGDHVARARSDGPVERGRCRQGLEPVLGSWSTALFAVGFVGTGLLAIPVLAGSGAAGIAGLLGKTFGFSRSPRQAPVFYGLVALGTVVGTVLTLTPVNPVQLLVVTAFVDGVIAAPFLVVVML